MNEGRGLTYLRTRDLIKEPNGMEVSALIRTRCGNMEEGNKYWIGKEVVFYVKEEG